MLSDLAQSQGQATVSASHVLQRSCIGGGVLEVLAGGSKICVGGLCHLVNSRVARFWEQRGKCTGKLLMALRKEVELAFRLVQEISGLVEEVVESLLCDV
ncbi:hypothetical protein C0Z10_10550 [Acidipropionibacterium jensenii]|uniref:Uncharacterized protein n=1 Tax=Acidipropionibacterium jensenii TaxID=1749 RepID=A0A3Q9UJB1_9ACTN|nr:hypothetical protein C0Z10_10550 [Acidipropionibacterium jensenii]